MFLLAFLALLIERFVGYPDFVYRLIGHPVTWMGKLISRLDRKWNREEDDFATRRKMGIRALLTLLGIVIAIAAVLQYGLLELPMGPLLLLVIAAMLPAQKSLEKHVNDVALALRKGGTVSGREAVSKIVGRDVENLDRAAVARAAIESLAENFSDGVVAPAFWMGIGGLPGGAAYKAANTADSMIGHKLPRYLAFGWAAARFDDLINLPASRLAAALFVFAAFFVQDASPGNAIRAIRRDARHHRSPNAGWPEAAMAGALGIGLAGPRSYGGEMIDAPYMGDGRTDLNADDIRQALKLARAADILLIALFGILAIIFAQA